jgi:hypothetical protein
MGIPVGQLGVTLEAKENYELEMRGEESGMRREDLGMRREEGIRDEEYPMKNEEYPISNVEYRMKNEEYSMSNVEYSMSNVQYPMSNEEYRMKNEEAGLNEVVIAHLKSLPVTGIEEETKNQIIAGFPTLYQSNNDLEEFCIRHQANPINVWYWFKQSKVLPQARASEIALEFLADAFRNILMDDDDGIIPLVGLPGEPRLMDRLEQHCFQQGFTSAQFMQLDGLIGRPINEYIEHHFFKNFSDHLNLFMYLPKTPFIWHLSSGIHQGFEAYIIIYKWNRDSLYKIKSTYLSKRTESLQYRLQQIGDSTSAQSQTEKETIRLQLLEIETFAAKIDELIAQGYDPKLDDGVGKNIAPLQQKGLLRAEVLNKKQLDKYLKADW